MTSRFNFPPSTPDRHSSSRPANSKPVDDIFGASTTSDTNNNNDPFRSSALASNRSTTPAGPPPSQRYQQRNLNPTSSTGSFTPAGAPSSRFLGSSIMRGVGGTTGSGTGAAGEEEQEETDPAAFTGMGGGFASAAGFTGKTAGPRAGVRGRLPGGTSNLFAARAAAGAGAKRNVPLGRSVQPRSQGPPGQGQGQHRRQPSRLSRAVGVDDDEQQQEEQPRLPGVAGARTFGVPLDDDDEEEEGEGFGEDDGEGDMWLDMPDANNLPNIGDESDLMMMATPAATERVRREAEDIFRATALQGSGAARRREFRYAALARDTYRQLGTAPLVEPPQVILGTENLVARLYDEGVGEAEDEDKMDDALATVAGKVAGLWKGCVDKFPPPTEEHAAEIGPGPHATPFEKAYYLANLALRIHHSRYNDDTTGGGRAEPLPETLFHWLNEYHDMYGNQVDEILRHRPSPACHSLFWQAVFIALLRGQVGDAARLLRQAGWGHVRRGVRGNGSGSVEYAYTGQALDNVQRAADETVAVLESCPGHAGHWDIGSSDWTLFRVRARAALEHLRRFAEGRENAHGESAASRQSMAGLARRAESQVPWEIYENLNVVFDIMLGQQGAILEAAQDWLEATVGLFGWWDDQRSAAEKPFGLSQSLSRSQALVLASAPVPDSESYLDRLARAFHAAVESDFHFNSLNPVEIGMASVFEDNIKAVIGLLRGWSLPIATAVAEIASLGKWLPPHHPSGVFGLEDLDMDDLEVLGMDPGAPDEVDGIKDSTLVQYAQALSDCEGLSAVKDKAGVSRDGWELSISVLGRMDSPERSDMMARDLVAHLVKQLHVDSNEMVDRLWTLLNELGMIKYAQDTAETYGDILARDSHRYGEAMWYYALAHRPNKVRDVMNLLISYSLIQSTAFPPTAELDDHLRKLLTDRKSTLEQCANQDMEAAELLGKMLSGYAALRQFYEIRDDGDAGALLPHATPLARRQQAAAALVSVVASSDDNIRGGLFDQTRDGIVSEDFLLALLGEALVFVSDPDNTNVHHHPDQQSGSGSGSTQGPVISLEHIDVLLKAAEDLEAVGSRVYSACDEFLQLVLASAPGGLKGSTPADLLRKSAGAGNFVLAGSSRVASQLQKSLSGGGNVGALGKVAVKRGWDWRGEVAAKTTGEDIVRRLRRGLARDLAGLWLAEADAMVW